MRNKIQMVLCFFRMLGTANWCQGIDKPNFWQYIYQWRISPKTAWQLANQIFNQ